MKTSPGSHCKSTGIVYAIHCKKCKLLYIGETGKSMCNRYGGHKYDIKKRPDNCDLAKHCRSSKHDLEKDLEITIIEHGIHNQDRRRRIEDKYTSADYRLCKAQASTKTWGLTERRCTLPGNQFLSDIKSYSLYLYDTLTLIWHHFYQIIIYDVNLQYTAMNCLPYLL